MYRNLTSDRVPSTEETYQNQWKFSIIALNH